MLAVRVARLAVPFVGVLALGFLSGAADPRIPDAEAATPRCSAQVIVFEDGTWAGGTVTIDGKKNTDTWTVTGPRYQGQTWRDSAGRTVRNFAFPPTFGGQPCLTPIGR